jgi:hypothetical protein
MTRIKVLNERIDASKTTFDSDKRTLLVMMIGLQSETNYRSLVQIWAATANMTGNKAIAMLREDLGRRELEKLEPSLALYTNKLGKQQCKYCQKTNHKEDQCWKKFPNLIPD